MVNCQQLLRQSTETLFAAALFIFMRCRTNERASNINHSNPVPAITLVRHCLSGGARA